MKERQLIEMPFDKVFETEKCAMPPASKCKMNPVSGGMSTLTPPENFITEDSETAE